MFPENALTQQLQEVNNTRNTDKDQYTMSAVKTYKVDRQVRTTQEIYPKVSLKRKVYKQDLQEAKIGRSRITLGKPVQHTATRESMAAKTSNAGNRDIVHSQRNVPYTTGRGTSFHLGPGLILEIQIYKLWQSCLLNHIFPITKSKKFNLVNHTWKVPYFSQTALTTKKHFCSMLASSGFRCKTSEQYKIII